MLSSFDGHVIGVVGWKGSGKTAVVEELVNFLSDKGFTVGTVKHVHGTMTLPPGSKDSMRHLAAGAGCTVTLGEGVVEVMSQAGDDIEQVLARYLCFCDYILVEGFKQLDIPKIVVLSGEGDPLHEVREAVAAVYRDAMPEKLAAFRFDEIRKLGAYLFESGILRESRQRITLLVNGKHVPMNEFVQNSFSGVIQGFLASLRGVGKASTIEVSIKSKS